MAVMAGSTVGTTYAGFWKRFVAWLIDTVIYAVIYGILFAIKLQAIAVIFALAYFFVYYPYMESADYQGTLGKILIGIKVTDLDGNKVSFGRSLGRNVAKIISAIILYIGYIMAGFTAKKQALHDRAYA